MSCRSFENVATVARCQSDILLRKIAKNPLKLNRRRKLENSEGEDYSKRKRVEPADIQQIMLNLKVDSSISMAVRENSIQKLRIEISAMDAAQIRELITDDFVKMVENNFKILTWVQL